MSKKTTKENIFGKKIHKKLWSQFGLVRAYCKKQGLQRVSVRFLYDGTVIDESKTPEDMSMEDEDVIECLEYSSALPNHGSSSESDNRHTLSQEQEVESMSCIELLDWLGERRVAQPLLKCIEANDYDGESFLMPNFVADAFDARTMQKFELTTIHVQKLTAVRDRLQDA